MVDTTALCSTMIYSIGHIGVSPTDVLFVAPQPKSDMGSQLVSTACIEAATPTVSRQMCAVR
jgi:hypothetical protein